MKILDLSHNNISFVSNGFFNPIELSLLELQLSFNEILKTTADVFGSMVNMQKLDISHNRIFEFEQDTFKNTKKLQVLLLYKLSMYKILHSKNLLLDIFVCT